MDKDEALKLALKALEFSKPAWASGVFLDERKAQHTEAIIAIKQALAAPVQEPALVIYQGEIASSNLPKGFTGMLYTTPPAQPVPVQEPVAWTDEQMLKMWHEEHDAHKKTSSFAWYKAGLKAANKTNPPAALVQEPTVWTATRLWNRRELWTCPADIERDLLEGYTTPPAAQPALKPLTDEQIWNVAEHCEDDNRFAFARAIEAAHGIKEKNT